MSHPTHRSLTLTAALIPLFLVGDFTPPALAATASDQTQSAPEQQPAKPMIKKEPMAGEMKKDGMMKEDVSKAAKQWSEKMDEKMKQEKMK